MISKRSWLQTLVFMILIKIAMQESWNPINNTYLDKNLFKQIKVDQKRALQYLPSGLKINFLNKSFNRI